MEPIPIAPGAPRSRLGENPWWDDQQEAVVWTDILAGRIYRWTPSTGATEMLYHDQPVGGFIMQRDGGLLLFRERDIALLTTDGAVISRQRFDQEGAARFNDVIADPEGRVFAGTIGKTSDSGGLYRLDPDGDLTKLFAGTGCSNGMGFSPDGATFYWTCSTTNQIFQFDYNRATGMLGRRRLFYQAATGEGILDGMALDADGCVWSARWGGGALVRHSPQGQPLQTLRFSCKNITSACFGGEGLKQLFVTSASEGTAAGPEDGALFVAHAPRPGLRRFQSNLL